MKITKSAKTGIILYVIAVILLVVIDNFFVDIMTFPDHLILWGIGQILIILDDNN